MSSSSVHVAKPRDFHSLSTGTGNNSFEWGSSTAHDHHVPIVVEVRIALLWHPQLSQTQPPNIASVSVFLFSLVAKVRHGCTFPSPSNGAVNSGLCSRAMYILLFVCGSPFLFASSVPLLHFGESEWSQLLQSSEDGNKRVGSYPRFHPVFFLVFQFKAFPAVIFFAFFLMWG